MATDNTYTKTYLDGDALLEADLDAGFQSVQPSISNLALSTTGSTSGYILASTGSNAVPNYIAPNTFAATITSTGANAILSVVSSCQASVANVIGVVMGASGAQAIATTMGSTGANIIAGLVSSVQASVANLVAKNVTRSVSDVVTYLGVGVSSVQSEQFINTVSSYVTVTNGNTGTVNVSVTITTSGRPVRLVLIPEDPSGSNLCYVGSNYNPSTATSSLRFMRDTTPVGVCHIYTTTGTAASIAFGHSPGSIEAFDFPVAGTYTYTIQLKGGGSSFVVHCRLLAYEL